MGGPGSLRAEVGHDGGVPRLPGRGASLPRPVPRRLGRPLRPVRVQHVVEVGGPRVGRRRAVEGGATAAAAAVLDDVGEDGLEGGGELCARPVDLVRRQHEAVVPCEIQGQ